jgi:hypothetical protein
MTEGSHTEPTHGSTKAAKPLMLGSCILQHCHLQPGDMEVLQGFWAVVEQQPDQTFEVTSSGVNG